MVLGPAAAVGARTQAGSSPDVAAALAHEFRAKIEQHKKELAAEKMKSDEIKTQESAEVRQSSARRPWQ